MNALSILAEGTEANSPSSWIILIVYVIGFAAIIYFLMIRPQKKQQAQHKAVVDSMEVGDSVLTTSGFYGVLIDVSDDMVIVEFGNNKNCRIPMQKDAIVEVEKANADE
ncbi:MAG: preprotein translocase subunit YajC [Lachnospiraceae bacterium]|nr:preprotein translocase subunit YajC [Lachnospiraceae bacterium]MDE6698872.1 preprotein translocase subunit YajC [Lachnospiraceae bacterium]